MERKILVIVDGHPTHKSKLVRSFVAIHRGRIELLVLSPYSPELNSNKLAWAHVQSKAPKKTSQTKEELTATVERALRQL